MEKTRTDAIEAAVFRRLLAHLDSRKDVQNIELMNLAGFCRNCLSKWYMWPPLRRWVRAWIMMSPGSGYMACLTMSGRRKYQVEASAEQLAAFNNKKA